MKPATARSLITATEGTFNVKLSPWLHGRPASRRGPPDRMRVKSDTREGPAVEADPRHHLAHVQRSASGPPPGNNACKDAKSDATTDDLTSVALKRDGDLLDVTWTMVERCTGAGGAGFYLNVSSENGNAGGQLGVKYLDGRQVAYFTSFGTNKEISGAAQVTAKSVTASFPMSEWSRSARTSGGRVRRFETATTWTPAPSQLRPQAAIRRVVVAATPSGTSPTIRREAVH